MQGYRYTKCWTGIYREYQNQACRARITYTGTGTDTGADIGAYTDTDTDTDTNNGVATGVDTDTSRPHE